MYFNNEQQAVGNLPAQPPADAAPENNPHQAVPGARRGQFREGGRVVIQPYIRPGRFTLRVGKETTTYKERQKAVFLRM